MPSESGIILGELRAQIAALQQSHLEHREESREGRKRMYDQLEDIRTKAAVDEAKTSHIERSVDELKVWKGDVVEKLSAIDKMRERGIGAIHVIRLQWMIGGAALLAAVAAMWKWILVKLGF